MCGIAGFQGRFSADLLPSMSARIARRGPDGDGTGYRAGSTPDGAVGFAHRRLAIIDLSPDGLQPMGVACPRCQGEPAAAGRRGGPRDDGLALVYNGEIYNFRDLRAALVAQGHAFHSATDSEVLLHLWAEHGPEMLGRLNGIFAFAICDGRERGRPAGIERGDVFLARDPLGVKPLYTGRSADGVSFASELKALLADPRLPRDIDLDAVHETLAYLWTPAPRTMLRAVRKVPPGHALVLRGGEVEREWRYYQQPVASEPLGGDEGEIAERVRDAVFAAVERQLVADVPVGAFLSGGLDSSAVVAGMQRVAPPARCYCIGFRDGDGVDGAPADLPYARRVAEHLGVPLTEIDVGADLIDRLGELLWILDEPQADPAPLNALVIAERARADGIPVLLSGAGGDDLFSGYRRHAALEAERWWGWLPAPVRRAAAVPAQAVAAGAWRGAGHAALPRRLAKAFAHADRDADERLIRYFWWNSEPVRRGLLAPDVAAAVARGDAATPLRETLARVPARATRLDRMLHLEVAHFLGDHNLNYTDKTGMAAGVEVRVPLLDLELVDLAGRIPARLKQKGRVGKAILKRAMEPVLPADVIYRGKTGFGAPLRRWLSRELRGRVDDTLSADAVARRGLFDPAAVRRLVEQDRSGRVDGSYTVFALLCIELWCRLFVDGEGGAHA